MPRPVRSCGSCLPAIRCRSRLCFLPRRDGNQARARRRRAPRRRALALPAMAALGGMIAPALPSSSRFNAGGAGRRGWGIPMATDIAFALGVVALLGTPRPALDQGPLAGARDRRRHRRDPRHRRLLLLRGRPRLLAARGRAITVTGHRAPPPRRDVPPLLRRPSVLICVASSSPASMPRSPASSSACSPPLCRHRPTEAEKAVDVFADASTSTHRRTTRLHVTDPHTRSRRATA